MRIGSVRDPERIEAGKQLLGGQRRRGPRRRTMRSQQRERKPRKASHPGEVEM
jgi:hypothetical protein